MKRAEILEAARVCVCGEREQDYGTPEDSFALIGKLWAAYMGVPFTPKDVAMLMALLKVARIKAGDKADSFVDLAGYAACAGEIATGGKENPCDPNLCDHCMYIGDGDFVCDLHGLGPEETVFVMEDWEPTEHFLQCRREARHE